MFNLVNINKSYGKNKVLTDLSLNIESDEFIAIMGRSGSGKTNLLNLLGFLDTPDSGTYMFNNKLTSDISDADKTIIRINDISFVFQNYELITRLTVFDNITLPLKAKKMNKKQIYEEVISVSKALNIERLLKKCI